jgi:GT2 family glycosyltransferase
MHQVKGPSLADLPAPPHGRTGWPWLVESPSLPPAMPGGQPWPRITIVTPSFNQGEFIEETIRSVLLQGYPNLEYIVIDGGSTDSSLAIIEKYSPWLSFWVSEQDAGQSDAINKGWRRATGEIMAWLNSDDVYAPSVLRQVALVREKATDRFLWYGLCNCFDEERLVGTYGAFYDVVGSLALGRVANIGQPAAFVSRSGLERVGLLNVGLRQSMDKDLWQRLAATGGCLFVPEVWAMFRVHQQQLTQRHKGNPNFVAAVERLVSLQSLYTLSDLPEAVLALRRKSLGRAFLKAARSLRAKGQTRRCLSALCHGIVSSFPPDREFLSLFVAVLREKRAITEVASN